MSWLEKHFELNALPCNVKTYKIFITPDFAKDILENCNNINIRKINKNRVAFYSRQMSNGDWELSDIHFDKHDNLLNGQHRLEAVCDSGVAVMFLVHYNYPVDVIIDTGFGRSISVYVEEIKKNEGAISSYLKAFDNIAKTGVDSMVSATELRNMADRNLHLALKLHSCVVGSKAFRSAQLIAAFGRAILMHPDKEDFILDGLRRMVNMEFGDATMQPLKSLAKFVINNRRGTGSIAKNRREFYLRSALCVQAYIDGVYHSKVYLPKNDPFPIR